MIRLYIRLLFFSIFYTRNFVIINANITAVISPIKPHIIGNFMFFTFILLDIIEITYNVVSVDAIIIEEKIPLKLSTP